MGQRELGAGLSTHHRVAAILQSLQRRPDTNEEVDHQRHREEEHDQADGGQKALERPPSLVANLHSQADPRPERPAWLPAQTAQAEPTGDRHRQNQDHNRDGGHGHDLSRAQRRDCCGGGVS